MDIRSGTWNVRIMDLGDMGWGGTDWIDLAEEGAE
jgi:hypothetical protein